MDKLLKQLSSKYKKDIRVIRQVANHPFKFIRDGMSNPVNTCHYRLKYLGIFAYKRNLTKDIAAENRINSILSLLAEYSDYIYEAAEINRDEDIVEYLRKLQSAKDYHRIATILGKTRTKIKWYKRNISKTVTKDE